ncbi:hypothetical protein LHYA1_G002042 [Lachnellula hyalina]|uniref:Uncharacterized protein n=1 Tax=Lachnellula hyalina TaxID=1316788 RepID=A0A8H8R8U5_9HELO|nr:uncharacterized protein LHYA1_G002042 [Lachnellula hyalina]TVY29811.1 hypothetical protein LHYA1_G002042 [Lachnellula hyalina]
MVNPSDVEILVHITAPSRGPDDARYRALAHAYLDFEPTRRHRIETDAPIGMEGMGEEEAQNQLQEELHQSTQEGRESEASYRPDEESAPSRAAFPYEYQHAPGFSQSLTSPQLSFDSVLDSPVFRPPNTWQQRLSQYDGSQEEEDSGNPWSKAPSTIADSQPENDRSMAAIASPATMLELILQQIDTSDETSLGETTSQRSSRSTRYGSHAIASSQDRLGGITVSKMASSSPMPVIEEFHLGSVIQVARTSSADQMTNERTAEAHTSFPTNKTIDSGAQMLPAISVNGISGTPSPALPRARPERYQTRSSSQSFGSVVPATSTPIISSSGREIRNEENDPVEASCSQLEVPATSTHGMISFPLSEDVSKMQSSVQIQSFEREIPPTATAPIIARFVQSATPQKQHKSTLESQTNLPPAMQEPNLQLKRKWPETIPESENVSSSAPATASSKSFPGSLRPQKRQHRDIGSSQSATTSVRIPLSDTTNISMNLPPSSQSISPWADKLEIRPGIPITASTDLTPEMLITPDLSLLAFKMRTASLFRPAHQSRDLRPMERGYWLVNCEMWSTQVRADTWKRLGDFVGKSRVGWGVWCVRDEQCSMIRVYCWGVIVGHIYLLLVLSSGNKMNRTRASWIGGDGEPLIKMP